MDAIGGYFELEKYLCDPAPLLCGQLVNSGRNALEYILRCIGRENIRTVYIPKYTCEVILEPFDRLGINYEFYRIGLDLKPILLPKLREDDFIIVNNYFGIQDKHIEELTTLFQGKIIVDNSQALFAPILQDQQVFFSPRKFFGLPDGGIAYAKGVFHIEEIDQSDDRISHLVKRAYGNAEMGYTDFQKNDSKLIGLPLKKMSALTTAMFERVDFENAKKKRKDNYKTLRETLEPLNLLETADLNEISCPMVYPFLSNDTSLRTRLLENKIYVAQYWPNIFDWCKTTDSEYILANKLLPLPIDQRYESRDMKRIIQIIVQK